VADEKMEKTQSETPQPAAQQPASAQQPAPATQQPAAHSFEIGKHQREYKISGKKISRKVSDSAMQEKRRDRTPPFTAVQKSQGIERTRGFQPAG